MAMSGGFDQTALVKVLVVEDEPVLARNIAEGLRDAGLAVDVALDGAEALDKLDLVHDDLQADLARRTVSRAGRQISLTRKEFGVLETLLLADGAAISAEELLER